MNRMNSRPLILALDQGTTGSTAALYDLKSLKLVAQHTLDFKQHYPAHGQVEHEGGEIWKSILQALGGCLKRFRSGSLTKAPNIAAVGITNQRETVGAWHRKTGRLLGRFIVWQDRRTAKRCDILRRNTRFSTHIENQTGLVIDPYFSGTKIEWLLKNNSQVAKAARRGEVCFGTIDTFLIWKLSGGKSFVTDHTNASRTLLYNLRAGAYDTALLKLFGVRAEWLPQILPSAGLLGATIGLPGVPDGTPIMGCLGDQQAALLGQECLRPGEAKITYGTGAFVLVNTGKKIVKSKHRLLATVAFSKSGERTFALEGSAFIAGAAVQFLSDSLGFFASAGEVERLALRDPRDSQLHFIPALAGLGAPWWNANARGVLMGLHRGTTKSQITRSVLESIAVQNVTLLKSMERDFGSALLRVGVDGGASQNDFLMQFQADVAGLSFVRPRNIESTSRGAALAARIGLGFEGLPVREKGTKVFKPRMHRGQARQITEEWQKAASGVDGWYR